MTGNKSMKVSSFSPVKTHYKSLKPMCSESRCLQSPIYIYIYIYILDIFYLHVIYKTDFKIEKNASKLRLGANKNCQTTCTILYVTPVQTVCPYCLFSVSRHSKQIKIKIKTVQQIKFGIWEMKGGKYTKTLAKIRARRIFRIRDIRRNVSPKFIEICLETPCWGPPGWAPTWGTETNKNICYRVLMLKREFIPRGTHKH